MTENVPPSFLMTVSWMSGIRKRENALHTPAGPTNISKADAKEIAILRSLNHLGLLLGSLRFTLKLGARTLLLFRQQTKPCSPPHISCFVALPTTDTKLSTKKRSI